MISLDNYWETNPEWYERYRTESGRIAARIKTTAPPEAKKSYENYLRQITHAAELEAKTGAHVI